MHIQTDDSDIGGTVSEDEGKVGEECEVKETEKEVNIENPSLKNGGVKRQIYRGPNLIIENIYFEKPEKLIEKAQ